MFLLATASVAIAQVALDPSEPPPQDQEQPATDREIAESADSIGALSPSEDNDEVLDSASLPIEIRIGADLLTPPPIQYGSGGLGSCGSGLHSYGSSAGLGGFGEAGTGQLSNLRRDQAEVDKPVQLGTPRVLGSHDRTQVIAVVERHTDEFADCYRRALQGEPQPAGVFVVKFVVRADGTVTSANAQPDTLEAQDMDRCFEGRFQRMVFSELEHDGLSVVTFPFLLTPPPLDP